MSAAIAPGGRVTGTRITVYDVLTYTDAGWHPSSIAAVLGLSTAQVESALKYVSEHEEEVRAKYRSIVERISRGNPPAVEVKRLASHERLLAKLRQIKQEVAGRGNAGNHGRPQH